MKNTKLIKMLGFTLLLLMIFELGKRINLPGIPNAVSQLGDKSSLVQFISVATGGNLMRPTLLSVGLGPYMTSMILWSAISLIDIDLIKNLTERQRGTVMRVVTLIISFLQALVLAVNYRSAIVHATFSEVPFENMLTMVVVLTAGGMVVAWFADMNMQKGVGMQMVLYLPGIVQGILAMLISGEQSLTTVTGFNLDFFAGMLTFTLLLMAVTLFVFNSERRIPYQQTGIDSKFNDSYLPIKLLNAGVMPFMFTSSLFRIPILFMGFPGFAESRAGKLLNTIFSLNSLPGVITYGVLFFVLSMGFSYVNVRPHDLAKNLKESGDYILNVKPGDATEHYITRIMTRVGVVGNSYLLLLSLAPLLIGLSIPWVQNISFYVGSVFFLIVITDTIKQNIEFLVGMNKYSIFD